MSIESTALHRAKRIWLYHKKGDFIQQNVCDTHMKYFFYIMYFQQLERHHNAVYKQQTLQNIMKNC